MPIQRKIRSGIRPCHKIQFHENRALHKITFKKNSPQNYISWRTTHKNKNCHLTKFHFIKLPHHKILFYKIVPSKQFYCICILIFIYLQKLHTHSLSADKSPMQNALFLQNKKNILHKKKISQNRVLRKYLDQLLLKFHTNSNNSIKRSLFD